MIEWGLSIKKQS